MGKLIQFPAARARRTRRPARGAFAAFGELESAERSQFKLFGACVVGAAALMGLLQLTLG